MNSGLIKFILISSMALTNDVYSSNFWIKQLNDRSYFITGKVEENDLVDMLAAANIIGLKTKEGVDFVDYLRKDCSDVKKTATNELNAILNGGITIVNSRAQPPMQENKLSIQCGIRNRGNHTWVVTGYADISKNPSTCQITIEDQVDFGIVRSGISGQQKKINGTVNCNEKASGTVQLLGVTNEIINVGDAKVAFYFNSGKEKLDFSTEKLNPHSFSLTFTLNDEGQTSGLKQASVVMLTNWD